MLSDTLDAAVLEVRRYQREYQEMYGGDRRAIDTVAHFVWGLSRHFSDPTGAPPDPLVAALNEVPLCEVRAAIIALHEDRRRLAREERAGLVNDFVDKFAPQPEREETGNP